MFFRVLLALGVIGLTSFRPPADEGLKDALRAMRTSADMAGAACALVAVDAATGDTIASLHPRLPMVPASTLKLFTTATALANIGEHRFSTRWLKKGRTLLLTSDDPSLGSPRFKENAQLHLQSLAEGMFKASADGDIEEIVILIDTALAPKYPALPWVYPDLGNYYAAPYTSPCWADNELTIQLKAGSAIGQPAILTGDGGKKKIWTEVLMGPYGSGDQAYAYPIGGGILLKGSIPMGQTVQKLRLANPSPWEDIADMLSAKWGSAGKAPLKFRVKTLTPQDTATAETAYTLWGPTVAELVKVTNYRSVNFYAEALLHHLGRGAKPAWDDALYGSGGLKAIRSRYGPMLKDCRLADGSGLSPLNRVNAGAMAALLRREAKVLDQPETLPMAGQSGTIKSLLAGTNASGRIRAKSGNLEGVRCYAGYATTLSGRKVVFSLMMNNAQEDAGRTWASRILLAMVQG